MPFKIMKLYLFPDKKLCVQTLPKTFRPITQNTHIFLFDPTKPDIFYLLLYYCPFFYTANFIEGVYWLIWIDMQSRKQSRF